MSALSATGTGMRWVLDGAMGTELLRLQPQRLSTQRHRCLETLCVSAPESVARVHRAYVAAGAGALRTHTFGANACRLRTHGMEARVFELNQAAVKIARGVAKQKIKVWGSVGPTGVPVAEVAARAEPEIRPAFRAQISALCSAGVDGIFLETFTNARELMEAISAVRSVDSRIPLVLCLSLSETLDLQGTNQVADVLTRLIASAEPWGVGFNCGFGAAHALAAVHAYTPVFEGFPEVRLVACPSAGLPTETTSGELRYPLNAAEYAGFASRLFESGVSVVGGCCGVGPDWIVEVRCAADIT